MTKIWYERVPWHFELLTSVMRLCMRALALQNADFCHADYGQNNNDGTKDKDIS